MRKSLVAASILMLCGSASFADSNPWFVGGEFGGMSMHTKTSGTVNGASIDDYKETINSTYEGVKVGKYFDFGRVYGNLSYQNQKDDLSSYTFGLGYDYLFKNKSALTPFIGLNASYSIAKYDTADAKTLSLDKPKGFNYGPEVGLLYAVTKNTELEVGVRYMISDVKDTGLTNDGGDIINAKLESEKIIQYYIGLNYKF